MQRLADFIAGIDGAGKRRAWQRHLDGLPRDATGKWHDLLANLPDDAWAMLKASTLQQINQHDPARSWRQVQDRFNEARAFLYLQAQGCEDVAFAPSSMTAAGPDLLARRGEVAIACEVKTIELDTTSSHMTRKLRSRLKDAVAQLAAIDADEAYIYLIVSSCDAITIGNSIDRTSLSDCHLVVDCDGAIDLLN